MGEDGCHAMGDSRQTLSAATKRLSGTMNGNVKKPMVWMGSGMLSLLFLLFFSYTTSCLFHGQSLADSGLFMTIGRWWTEGIVPYRDIFDTKGPLVYLLNAIGWWLTGGRTGIFILQWVNLTVTGVLAYHLLLTQMPPRKALALAAVTLLALCIPFEGGNSVEEWMLPMLFASFYGLLRLTDKHYDYRPKMWAVVYGVTIGVALLTRITDALGLCGALLVAYAYRLCHGQRRMLVTEISVTLLSTVALCLPFLVMMALNGSLANYFYDAFHFNFLYVAYPSTLDMSLFGIASWLKGFFGCWLLLLVVMVMMIVGQPCWRYGLWLGATLMSLPWFVMGQGYHHYAIICAPYVALALVECCRIGREGHECVSKMGQRLIVATVMICLVFELHSSWKISRERCRELPTMADLIQRVPNDERRQMLIYGSSPDVYYYLRIHPVCPYVCYQEMACERDAHIAHQLQQLLSSSEVRWVLVEYDAPHIEHLLNAHYHLVARGAYMLRLYKRL